MADSNTKKTPKRASRPNPKKVRPDPCAIVIFGAGGDLTKRLVVPALYNLMHGGELPENFVLIGADLAEGTTESWGRTGSVVATVWISTVFNASPPAITTPIACQGHYMLCLNCLTGTKSLLRGGVKASYFASWWLTFATD